MLYGNYRFNCRFEGDAELPVFKGSTFRGVFGHALKRAVCALKRQDCPECILRERCLYTRVFETALAQGGRDAGRNSVIPHPFVIEPPPETTTRFSQGDAFECGLILFGEFNHMLPYFVYAFEQMGAIGVGRKINGSRGGFSLLEVKSGGRAIYSSSGGKLETADAAQPIPAPLPRGGPGGERRVSIRLETPLRFKQGNRLSDGLPFEALVRNMLRRASSLMEAYGEGEPPLDYRGLVARAGAVATVRSDLRWTDWERFSNRQDRAMNLGGLTGAVTYKGLLDEFLPLIEFSEKVHVGKQTSFGLGRIRISPLGSSQAAHRPTDTEEK